MEVEHGLSNFEKHPTQETNAELKKIYVRYNYF